MRATHEFTGADCLCLGAIACLGLLLAAPSAIAQSTFLTFDTLQVRPLAVSPDNTRLFAVNTPDNQLEIFDIEVEGTLAHAGSVQVGMEPCAVAARNDSEVWVVNFLSDSVSVVDVSGAVPRVVRTLHVGDEPSDVVFAGPGGNRAFITTAHRGQNTPFPDGEYDTAGIGRADIWVFDATALGSSLGGDEMTIVNVFGDKPRGLAVSNDGSTVYAAVYHSGNQTMTLNSGFVCPTGTTALNNDTPEPACSLAGGTSPGGMPPPHQNQPPQSIDRPENGIIVKWKRDGVSNEWQDELGRNWNDWVKFNLPDRDVFAINANANPPVAIDGSSSCANGAGCWAGVGTILFNLAVNPVSGKIYVSNTDAQNHVRFEGPGIYADGIKPMGEPTTVQGNLAHARISVLDGANVLPRHLNKHIDYSVRPAPAGVKENSLATPLGMVVTPDGNTLYVAAFGSGKVGVFDTASLEDDSFIPDSADHITLSGGGPSGLVLAGNNHLYVLTRFDNSISVVRESTRAEVQTVVLHNPEPVSVVDGRPFLYDANLTSSNGEASCSSCHIGGDLDDLAWDLGNPDDDRKNNNNPMNDEPFVSLGLTSCQIQNLLFGNGCTFHPMKGPMTTQSLRGLELQGPQHWRGDREGDAASSFVAFNVAFPGLVGRDSPLTAPEMVTFKDFALKLRYPPNPTRNLDNSLTQIQSQGQDVFNDPNTVQVASCNDCHTIEPENGFFGGDGRSTFDAGTEIFKVPHLRNMYQKVGMFGEAEPEPATFPLVGTVTAFDGPFTHTGDQIRGFGFTHSGSVDTLFRFVSASIFTLNNNEQSRVEAFLIAVDTDLAPIVGQQATLTDTNSGVAVPRIDLMATRCATSFDSKVLFDLNGEPINECDLIAKHNDGTTESGYLYDPSGGDFTPDDGTADITDAALKALAGAPNNEVTYTAVPPGSGYRMGINRDLDTLNDGLDNCPGAPNDDQLDTDSDGLGDVCDPTPIPEPSGTVQLISGVFALAALERRRRRRVTSASAASSPPRT
jgi:DNA-binding beta-propeller fold protein YncE